MEVKDYQQGLLIIHTFVLQLFHTLRTKNICISTDISFFATERIKDYGGIHYLCTNAL